MTEKEVKQIVKDTVNELLGCNMIKYSDRAIYNSVSDRLRDYYRNAGADIELTEALHTLRDNYYFGVLEMYYRDGYTLEQLAEEFECDISTVVRNKKSLCLKLFDLID